jgi:hypothetical protein
MTKAVVITATDEVRTSAAMTLFKPSPSLHFSLGALPDCYTLAMSTTRCTSSSFVHIQGTSIWQAAAFLLVVRQT